jgi:hypothetical protein
VIGVTIMRRLTVLLVGLVALGAVLRCLWAFQLEPAQEEMWRKLDLSHAVLDALALDDFEALSAYAEDLVSLSEASAWFGQGSERYQALSDDYRAAVLDLQNAARSRNTDAAAFAYVDMILRCVRCHQEMGRVPRK